MIDPFPTAPEMRSLRCLRPLQALHRAAELGNGEAVDTLLLWGAQVDARSHYLDTPLHFAAREGQLAVASRLISSKADVSATTKFGATPREHVERSRCGQWEALLEVLASAAASGHS